MLAQVAPLACTALVLGAIAAGQVSVPLLYVVVVVTGLASSFENPARQALLPQIVPRALFTKAITMNSTLQSLAFVSGPAIAGGLIATSGVGSAYVVHGVLLVAGILSLAPLHVPDGERRGRVTVEAIREGIAFVRHRPVLLGAMTLDMFAVVFGGAKALLPIYAVDILHAGPVGYGVLSGSLEAGALLMSVLLIARPTVHAAGRMLLLSVAAFGLATMLFGLSRSFPLSVALYMAVGMADQLSVVMRGTTIQLATPDALRGRVSAVNSVFISASNQLGSVESGIVAALTTATFAVVSGGAGCLLVVALIAWRIPELRSYRSDRPTDDDDQPPVAQSERAPEDASAASPGR
jgi:MFS family permease